MSYRAPGFPAPCVTVWLALFALWPGRAGAEWVWVEGEKPAVNQMTRHPWYDQVKKEQFSGGDFISHFNQEKAGEAEYRFVAPKAGEYEFWVRANPVQARLAYQLNGGAETVIDLDQDKRDLVNVAGDDKPDLRFLAWSKAGKVALRAGENTVRFRMTSGNSHHGYLDCFVLSTEPLQPRGILKPDQLATPPAVAEGDRGWFAFDPPPDKFAAGSAIDLRFLNEQEAGEHGHIGVKDGDFIHTGNGQPVKFWAVNGPPHELKGEALRRCARLLAKYGVNLVRVHGGYFDQNGEVDRAKVKHAHEIVEAMKAEGIYTLFSIYFPLWLTPKPDTAWLRGYNGKDHPFAALLFNPDFQAQYRKWWTALLTTPNPATGKTLATDPAVAGLEMQNEDSFFFWTFAIDRLPDEQARLLEKMFGDWLVKKHGSLEATFAKWGGAKLKRDVPAEGRVSFRPLWNIANEKTSRDQDTARFLWETQTKFYTETHAFLRQLGFKGPITASNWSTASPEVLGPLEKMSYATGDFIDRHGYFGSNHKGSNAEWSVRDGHTYRDRSALRFEAEDPAKPRQFVHPAMDPHYDNKPSMISETTWNRPNRYRSEAPLYFAVYCALQHSDAIVHFAFDGARWAVKPGFFMQPWTLMSPAMLGQFPAAALIFRRGLVAPGAVLADLSLNREDLLNLKGTPLPQDAALDELRLKDVPTGTELKPGQRLDPLLHYAGRADVRFVDSARSVRISDLKPLIDHARQTVTSSTGELKLEYGPGLVTINAPRAQGASGNLQAGAKLETRDLIITSGLDLAHIVVVSLDDQPLASSRRMLLQVMSEEKPSGFASEAGPAGTKKITSIGVDPWRVKELSGSVKFKRADAARLKVTALDFNGYPAGAPQNSPEIKLAPATVYYLIER